MSFVVITTSIGLAVLVFKESMNVYFWLSLLFAALTVVCFIKGKIGGVNLRKNRVGKRNGRL